MRTGQKMQGQTKNAKLLKEQNLHQSVSVPYLLLIAALICINREASPQTVMPARQIRMISCIYNIQVTWIQLVIQQSSSLMMN